MKFSRRNFLAACTAVAAGGVNAETRRLVIDAHCHAGQGQEIPE
jgi:hypothetical protein